MFWLGWQTVVLVAASLQTIPGSILNGSKDPQIFSVGKVYRVKAGESVLLECEVDNLKDMILLWKTGARVLTAGSMKVRRDSRLELAGTNLLINSVEQEDAGDYDCEVESERDTPISIRHSLDVLFSPTISPDPSSGQVVVKEGTSVTLACQAEGNPQPTITWHRGDQLIHTGSALTLAQVGRLHAGSYTCSGSNGVGDPATAKLSLHVLYPPVLEAAGSSSGLAGSGGRVLGGIGRRVELRCRIWAEPEPEVKWFKNGLQELTEIPGIRTMRRTGGHLYSLVLERMSEVDFGEYLCEARNSLGSGKAHLQISGKPQRPEINRKVWREGPGAYRISWRVRTYRPILAHALYVRKVQDTEDSGWNRTTIQESFHDNNGEGEEVTAFTLTDLQENQKYQVQVEATNFFGSSELSEVFEFLTEDRSKKEGPTRAPIPTEAEEHRFSSLFRLSSSCDRPTASTLCLLTATAMLIHIIRHIA